MSRASAGHDLEARVEALRRELAALIVTLCNTGQRLEDLADELRSRRQMDKVVALDRRRHGSEELGRPLRGYAEWSGATAALGRRAAVPTRASRARGISARAPAGPASGGNI